MNKHQRCDYCKKYIDCTIDFCRCCHGCLTLFYCPGCCNGEEVRCYRLECSLKAKNEKQNCPEEKDFSRDLCSECSGCSTSDCELDLECILCASCGEFMDNCQCGIIKDLYQYHHKCKFFKQIYSELMPIAWHPDRVIDWCIDEGEKEFLKELWQDRALAINSDNTEQAAEASDDEECYDVNEIYDTIH